MREARDDQGRALPAYNYNELTRMAEMEHGDTLALMNAQNYVHFAIGTFCIYGLYQRDINTR